MKKGTDYPVYSRMNEYTVPSQPYYWPLILEKAWAKTNNNYEEIYGGQT